MALEYCIVCEEPTGRAGAGEDSLYDDNGHGPFCGHCFEKYAGKDAEIARLRDYSTGLHDFVVWLSQRHEHDGLSKGQIIRMAARMDVGGKWQDDHVKFDGRTAIEVLDAEIASLKQENATLIAQAEEDSEVICRLKSIIAGERAQLEKADALVDAVLWLKERQDIHNFLTDKLVEIEREIHRAGFSEDGWRGILKLRENVVQARLELVSLCPDRSDIELSLAPVEFTSEEELAIALAKAYKEARHG